MCGKTDCKSERKCVKHLKRLRNEKVARPKFQTNVEEELVFTCLSPRDRAVNKARNV